MVVVVAVACPFDGLTFFLAVHTPSPLVAPPFVVITFVVTCVQVVVVVRVVVVGGLWSA